VDNSLHSVATEPVPATAAANPPPKSHSGLVGWLKHAISSAVVLAVLGGVLVWGHATGWKVDKFSDDDDEKKKDDWCPKHGVPKSVCVECNPDLLPRPTQYLWCEKHGVFECPLDHPDIAQTLTPVRVTPADLERAQRALDFTERPQNNKKDELHKRRIQFTSEEAVKRAGIKIVKVGGVVDDDDDAGTKPMLEAANANGEITFDQTRMARLSARVPGAVSRALKQVGDPVKQGEVLALVDAAEVGKTKAEFLQALAQTRLRTETHRLLKEAYPKGGVSDQSLRESASALSEAQIRLTTAQQALTNLGLPIDADSLQAVPQDKLGDRLRFLGLPDALAGTLDPKMTTANLLPVASPFEGVVVSRDVVAGEVVDKAKVLFLVVDTRQMWLTLSVRLEDAKALAVDQPVEFRPDGAKEDRKGKITWISPEADRKTRTVKVRAVLANTDGRLKANTFGAGKIIFRDEPNAIVVPNKAVHRAGGCYVVFIRDKQMKTVFHTRTVRVGARDADHTEIIAGVLAGECVATNGSGVLRDELLRGERGGGDDDDK
jgi:cobalt-zinc-cadmium efflux system membrane fusion protein